MNTEYERFWKHLARRERDSERHVVGGEEADRLLSELPDEALKEQDLEDIVTAVVSGRSLLDVRSDSWEEAGIPSVIETGSVERDALLLHRNKGEEDEEAEARLDELRREALEDDAGEGA